MSVGIPTAVVDYSSTATATTHSKAVATGVSVGQFLMVVANISNVTNAMTMTDSKGNTWTPDPNGPFATAAAGNTARVQVFYSKITTALVASTDTLTLTTTPSAVRANFIAFTVTGFDTTTPIRANATANNDGGTANAAWAAPSKTATSGDLILSGGAIGGASATIGTLTNGFTQYLKVADTRALVVLYKQSTGETVASTGTLGASNPWSAFEMVVASATVSNNAPTANAGSAQTNIDPFSTVTLNGTGSSDPDVGDTITYVWTQTAGTTVTLSSTTVASPTFTAPATSTGGTLTFSLVVTDNHGLASSASTVNITVLPHNFFQIQSGGLAPARITAL